MKGFTLIELLAVIVILAIILMIATPMITGVVNNARRDAQISSVRVFAKEIDRQVLIDEINTPVLTWGASQPTVTINGTARTNVRLLSDPTVVKVKPAMHSTTAIYKQDGTGILYGTVVLVGTGGAAGASFQIAGDTITAN